MPSIEFFSWLSQSSPTKSPHYIRESSHNCVVFIFFNENLQRKKFKNLQRKKWPWELLARASTSSRAAAPWWWSIMMMFTTTILIHIHRSMVKDQWSMSHNQCSSNLYHQCLFFDQFKGIIFHLGEGQEGFPFDVTSDLINWGRQLVDLLPDVWWLSCWWQWST